MNRRSAVSLISNYRSQFTSMLKRMSFAQLLDRLRNREASVGPLQVQERWRGTLWQTKGGA